MLETLQYLYNQIRFADRFRDDLYEKILGHHKVIARERGNPLYSLLIPAFMGDHYRHATVAAFLGHVQNRQLPMVVNFAITDRCDCSCRHCYFAPSRQDRPLLSSAQALDVLEQAQQLGTSTVAFVGGEPLLRRDLATVVGQFDSRKTNLVCYTNGSHLERRAKELRKAGLTKYYVSLEYPDAQRHDDFVGLKGVFDRAMRGVAEAQKQGALVGLSVTLHEDTTVFDLRTFFRLAQEVGAVELFVSPELGRKPMGPDTLTNRFAQEIGQANHNRRIPFGILYYPSFVDATGFGGCTAGGTRLYVSPYGDVTPCDLMRHSFGQVTEEPLHAIWDRMVATPGFGTVSGPCRSGLDRPRTSHCDFAPSEPPRLSQESAHEAAN
jgi:MoaA/NifB/PqqE/SkfB family radical SAM enzyme